MTNPLTSRYTVLMRNTESNTAAAPTTATRTTADATAWRAERRAEVVAGVIGHRGGPDAPA